MSISKVMVGMSIIGQATNDPIVITQILTGQFELEIKYAFYYMEKKELPTSETLEDVNIPEVLTAYNRLLDLIRNSIIHNITMDRIQNNILKRKQKRIDEKNEKIEIEERLKRLSAPHHLGTVAEICQKYNLSKSVVRKMKADGTLEAFCLAKDVEVTNKEIK